MKGSRRIVEDGKLEEEREEDLLLKQEVKTSMVLSSQNDFPSLSSNSNAFVPIRSSFYSNLRNRNYADDTEERNTIKGLALEMKQTSKDVTAFYSKMKTKFDTTLSLNQAVEMIVLNPTEFSLTSGEVNQLLQLHDVKATTTIEKKAIKESEFPALSAVVPKMEKKKNALERWEKLAENNRKNR